jgi:hypothetical protein
MSSGASLVKSCASDEQAQLVRFIVLELIQPDLNIRFNMCVIFMTNYSFSMKRCLRRQRDAFGDRLCESQDQADSVFRICS